MLEVLATYQGKGVNHIVTEHPWDTEVDELVILGEHVTLDSGTGLSIRLLVLVRMTTNVGIANGLEVAVTVNEHGIMMENAGPDFAGPFYDKVVPTVIETWRFYFLLKKKSLSLTHLTGGRKANHLACRATMVCFCFKIPPRNLG